jgi:hypothetical protein
MQVSNPARPAGNVDKEEGMTVYVDRLASNGRWGPCGRFLRSCHLFADSLDELHAFAARIGMKREWFQGHSSLGHYDLTANRRKQAVKLGAVEIPPQEVVAMIQRQRDRDRINRKG